MRYPVRVNLVALFATVASTFGWGTIAGWSLARGDGVMVVISVLGAAVGISAIATVLHRVQYPS